MIGSIIGSYKVTEKIGEGGMGAVFKGIDTMLEREVAIKMLKPELASQPDIVERFRSEAVTLAKLNHPNIATLYSFLRQEEDFFMVMEFVPGKSLDDVIRKFGAIDCNRAIMLFCQALEGIDHAHRMGIIHRDLKPANIMLTDNGSIKVMDFGIARALGTARMTRQGNVVGTVEYMAPEQVRGQAADGRSDIYSLGIVLYEMLTGRVPFENDSEFELMRAQVEDAPKPPRTFAPNIPLAVEQAIMRALAKKPEARPQTAGELRAALLATLNASTAIIGTTIPYAAPTTRVLEPPPDLAAGEKAVKKTTLSDEPVATQVLGASSGSAGTTGDRSRETLPDKTGLTAAVPAGQRATGSANASTSVFARLNWKHYAAAVVVVVALIVAAAVALRGLRGAEARPPEAADQSQAESEAPSTATPAGQAVAPSDNPVAPSAGLANDPARANASTSASNANVERSARSRGNQNNQTSEAQNPPDSSSATTPAATPAPQPPTPSQIPDVSNKEPTGPATQNVNQNSNKEEKKGGIGGFFKKVFKGGEKKNDNKSDNKNQKK
ncbi:MAG TPA: serine/threonine-protein kinase [Blastocatellia bacterium]|nr:serine/threonine-protein kinase [Blastocatellia bacterium]